MVRKARQQVWGQSLLPCVDQLLGWGLQAVGGCPWPYQPVSGCWGEAVGVWAHSWGFSMVVGNARR